MSLKIIAEIGNNHNGNLELAKKMAAEAINSGADYIKFQVYNIKKFIAPGNEYYEDLKNEALSFEDFKELKKFIALKGGQFLATPFDVDSLNFLHELGITTVKIASGDFDNFDLLEQVIHLKMKLIISIGGAEIEEIDHTIAFLKDKNAEFSLLHCVLAYPASMDEVNLSFINTLQDRYNVSIGYSDHTLGIEASLGAIALGAVIIEKHFTTNKSLPGGDNEMSINPIELTRLCIEGKNIEQAIGAKDRHPSKTEAFIRTLVKRIYYAKRDILAGQKITHNDVHLLRPKNNHAGFFAIQREQILGKKAVCNIKTGDVISINVIN